MDCIIFFLRIPTDKMNQPRPSEAGATTLSVLEREGGKLPPTKKPP
jgi:hypothetical protein